MRAPFAFLVAVVLGTLSLGAGLGYAHTAPPHLRPASAIQAQVLPNPPPGQVALKLDWVFYPRPIPGAILAYEPTGKANSLWASESLKKGQAVPVGKEYKGSIIFLEPGKKIFVTLVYRNPSNKPVNFYVVPHQVVPTSGAATVWLTCLCMSLIYGAPAGGTWYRTIGVGVAPETTPGTKWVAVHTVIADPAMFPKE